MRDVLQYYGAAASTIAALMVALNLGRKWNGAAMIVFVTSSIALIAWGFLQPGSKGIGWQNVALLLINLVGAHRYLIHDARKRAGRPNARAFPDRTGSGRSERKALIQK